MSIFFLCFPLNARSENFIIYVLNITCHLLSAYCVPKIRHVVTRPVREGNPQTHNTDIEGWAVRGHHGCMGVRRGLAWPGCVRGIEVGEVTEGFLEEVVSELSLGRLFRKA